MSGLTQEQHEQIRAMRRDGHAVVVFTEDEMLPSNFDAGELQDRLIARGNALLEEQRRTEDHDRSAIDLDDVYNPDGNGEHPDHTKSDWIEMVACGGTVYGYWEWVHHMIQNPP